MVPIGAFKGCTITAVTMHSNVVKVDERAFRECASLSTVNLPTSVIEISKGAFQLCTSLSTIKLPASVSIIGENAFGSNINAPCNSDTATLNVPNSMAVSVYSAVQFKCTVVKY